MTIGNAVDSFGDFDLPRCDLAPTAQSATRSLPGTDSDTAGVAVPANVHYRRGRAISWW